MSTRRTFLRQAGAALLALGTGAAARPKRSNSHQDTALVDVLFQHSPLLDFMDRVHGRKP